VGILDGDGHGRDKDFGPWRKDPRVDTDSVFYFESSVAVDIQWVGDVAAVCCGGESLFNTTLTGPGKFWLESFGIDKKVVQTGGGNSSNVYDGGK
jgi:uncharacterized protein (AIM24 family)